MIISKKTALFMVIFILFDMFAYDIGGYLNILFHSIKPTDYTQSLILLTYQHIEMVFLAEILSIAVGVILGILATRDFLSELFFPINLISSVSQSFPPVAVLALSVSIVGFGVKPTIIALFIYGLFPIIQNTIAGINSIDKDILDACLGMGMDRVDILFLVELPLSLRTILSGIRISVTINIAVAAIGAVVGAGGLGSVIISGLINENQFFIAYGSISLGLLSIIFDSLLDDIQNAAYRVLNFNLTS